MVHLFTHLNLCTLMSKSKREFQKYTGPLFSSFDLGPHQTSCAISGWRWYPSVAGTPSRNFIPDLEVGCNLAPVSGWLTWRKGNFHIILIPPIWGRPGLATWKFSLSQVFGLNFYERWTVAKWLAIFTYICVCMQCKNLINVRLLLIWYNLKQRSA